MVMSKDQTWMRSRDVAMMCEDVTPDDVIILAREGYINYIKANRFYKFNMREAQRFAAHAAKAKEQGVSIVVYFRNP